MHADDVNEDDIEWTLKLTKEERDFLIFKLQWDRQELVEDPSKHVQDLQRSLDYADLLGGVIVKLGADPYDSHEFILPS